MRWHLSGTLSEQILNAVNDIMLMSNLPDSSELMLTGHLRLSTSADTYSSRLSCVARQLRDAEDTIAADKFKTFWKRT